MQDAAELGQNAVYAQWSTCSQNGALHLSSIEIFLLKCIENSSMTYIPVHMITFFV